MIGMSLASGPYIDTKVHFGLSRLQTHPFCRCDAYSLECAYVVRSCEALQGYSNPEVTHSPWQANDPKGMATDLTWS